MEELPSSSSENIKTRITRIIDTVLGQGKIRIAHWQEIERLTPERLKGDPEIALVVLQNTEQPSVVRRVFAWSGPGGDPKSTEVMVQLILTGKWRLLMQANVDVGGDVLGDDRVVQYFTNYVRGRTTIRAQMIPALNEKTVALKYVRANDQMLEFVGQALRQDKDVVLTAIQTAIQNSPPTQLSVPLTVQQAFRNPDFHNDIEIIRAALRHPRITIDNLLFGYRGAQYLQAAAPAPPPTNPSGPSLCERIRAGAALMSVTESRYAEVVLRDPRAFIISVAPCEEPECWGGNVTVTITNFAGVTEDHTVKIDILWETTAGFRNWYGRHINDDIPDFSVVVGSDSGKPGNEVPLIDVRDPQFQVYVQYGFLRPSPAAPPVQVRGVGQRGFRANMPAGNRLQRARNQDQA